MHLPGAIELSTDKLFYGHISHNPDNRIVSPHDIIGPHHHCPIWQNTAYNAPMTGRIYIKRWIAAGFVFVTTAIPHPCHTHMYRYFTCSHTAHHWFIQACCTVRQWIMWIALKFNKEKYPANPGLLTYLSAAMCYYIKCHSFLHHQHSIMNLLITSTS